MKRTILTAALAACALSATAQIMEERNPVPMTPGGGRVYRTEVVPYDARHDAEARNREAGGYWKAFEPEVTIATEGPLHAVLEQEIEIPFAWTDGMVYLHVENPGSAYSLWLNDRQVAEVSDPLTPAEFDLTPFIREGANDFKLLMRNDNPARQLDGPRLPQVLQKQLPLLPEQTLDRRFRNRTGARLAGARLRNARP